MIRWQTFLAGPAVALAMVAGACGGDDDDTGGEPGSTTPNGAEATASGDGGGDAAWTGEYDTGTKVSVELFVDASDPALADFERLREAVGAPAVVYGRVTAENITDAPDTGRFLTLTDGEGDQFGEEAVIVDFACALAYRWSQTAGITTEAIQTYTSLYNNDCGGATIAGRTIEPGQTVTFFVAVEGGEPEFERVFSGAGQELE